VNRKNIRVLDLKKKKKKRKENNFPILYLGHTSTSLTLRHLRNWNNCVYRIFHHCSVNTNIKRFWRATAVWFSDI